ncbi:MAG: hypothetical protein SFV51_08850 [Bryobacteraceae bacterium]|nr:hypothetical protein [Bryobacteraceae bacterium]
MTEHLREHPEYVARKAIIQKYRDLYVGGEALKANAPHYLQMRPREPLEVYQQRLSRVFYENYVGSIIDWYSATLFRKEPMLSLEGTDESGRRFFSQFVEDCDMKGTSLVAMLRQQFASALVYGSSYLLIDFPVTEAEVYTRAQEEELGVARAYLAEYTPADLVNWAVDERGNHDWVVLRTSRGRQVDGRLLTETRWTYYDRENYRVFESMEGEGKPRLLAEGRHGVAKLRRVPLFELKISDGLWMMNKAALLQIEHFNKSNALAWAITMGLFAMPVIYSEREWQQIVGESFYIQLSPQDRFGWTEPEGRVYQLAADNLVRLQEEIYRVCYLLHQARGVNSGGFSQSGLSKQRDFAITQEVLRAYGDVVKDFTKKILRTIRAVREDEIEIDVSGMDDFDIGELSGDIADAERLFSLGVQSPTLKTQIFKKLASKYLCDVRQDIKDRINQEIDSTTA